MHVVPRSSLHLPWDRRWRCCRESACCALSYARVLDFMRAVGTAFDPSHAELKPLSPANQLAEMEAEVSQSLPPSAA